MSFRESLACGLQKCVGNLWKGDDYSDFIVIVENTSFKCHRFILSACSGFFQGLFKSPMKEQTEGCAKLEGMTSSTFDIIINAVYKGIDRLSIDNVLGVWAASEMLQIGYLTQQCHTFVMENISVDNYFLYFKHATLYSAENVVDHCLNFMSRNFKQFKDEDNLLHLPFDQFYKVIADDDLAVDHEEIVVDTILNWVKYAPRSRQTTSLNTGNNSDDTNDDHSKGEDSHDSKPVVSCDVTVDCTKICSQITVTAESITTPAVLPVQCSKVSKNATTDETEIENRKQHLVKLLRTCRLFTVKSDFLDNTMKNNIHLLVDTGAYPLMQEALMYTLDVSRRHDTWPEAAVYRASSKFKHVMVFLSDDEVWVYDLNTGKFIFLNELPEEFESDNSNIVVFGNILYLIFNNDNECNTKHFYILEGRETWHKVNSIHQQSVILLLPHGNNIYYCCSFDSRLSTNDRKLDLFCCAQGQALQWLKCGQLESCGNYLIRFHKYILVFGTQNNVTTAECYNTEIRQTHKCETSMSGTSKDMVSFTHGEDVYILQRNGSLWKIFGTDTTPVDFELVFKIWEFDIHLTGCVLFRKKLFLFHNDSDSVIMPPPNRIFTGIKLVKIKRTTQCLPMILEPAL